MSFSSSTMEQRSMRESWSSTDQARRLFACTFEGCRRSFSRSEHLHRHSLNHTEGEATCPRCSAHFKRKDLLERHLNRHRQKDDEAGGEGKGQLNTRKRMWKDPNGRIVQKKPKESTNSELNYLNDFQVHSEGPISPPISSEGTSYHGATHEPLLTDSSILSGFQLPPEQFGNQGFNGLWMPQQQQQPRELVNRHCDINYDDVFHPDTASSFNMPYNTQGNYDWLFNLTGVFEEPTTLPHSNPVTHPPPTMPDPAINAFSLRLEHPLAADKMSATVSSDSRGRGQYAHTVMSQPSPVSQTSSKIQVSLASPDVTSSGRSERSHSIAENGYAAVSPHKIQAMAAEVDFERPLAFLRHPESLPKIDETTYFQILQTIDAARPLAPDGTPLHANHPLLSLQSLQSYCDLYFTKFNTAYPLIHRATFDARRFEPLLIVSVVLLGATFSNKDAHQLAVCVHDVIRPQIFAHASFNPKPDLWVLQTILLVECFGKSRAGQKQHDMSHLFHGMLINLIRRSDCQTLRPSFSGDSSRRQEEPEKLWRKWAEAEEKKRLALLCFMWDTQHAVLFCQSLCMSAFELRLAMPCNQALWEASSAAEWVQHARSTPPEPLFLLALKSYLTPGAQRLSRMNGLSRIILFHSLMSIFWDMQRRDQTSLGVIPGPCQTGRWETRLEAAYEIWKVDFDNYCAQLSSVTKLEIKKGSVDSCATVEFDAWHTAYVAVYHAAHVLLRSDFLDIQIYAGARFILGKPVQRDNYIHSERIIKQWAGSGERQPDSDRSNAATAAWHAAQLLRAASQTLIDYDSMGLFHVPWCLYLATLTIWAFHYVGSRGSGFGTDDDSDIVWDAQADMNSLIDTMTEAGPDSLLATQGTKRTGGLAWVIAGALSKVRWGIVHAGVTVLRGLVPARVIGQFEDGF